MPQFQIVKFGHWTGFCSLIREGYILFLVAPSDIGLIILIWVGAVRTKASVSIFIIQLHKVDYK